MKIISQQGPELWQQKLKNEQIQRHSEVKLTELCNELDKEEVKKMKTTKLNRMKWLIFHVKELDIVSVSINYDDTQIFSYWVS